VVDPRFYTCVKSDIDNPARTAKWWWYFPVILAVVFALWQVRLAQRHGLTPSKGGAFGLFSTVDKLENRNLRAYLLTKTQEIPFAIPQTVPSTEELRKPIYRAASLPIETHLQALTDELVKKPFTVPFTGIRVETWKMDFDSTTLRASRIKVVSRTVDAEGHAQP
jgi:hypothetical protein